MAAGDSVESSLLILLLGVAAVLLVIAVRHRLAFRIGVRNVFRARRRTALLVAGLLVATSIISGSLVVGDTVDTLVVHYTVLAVGTTDEVIGNQTPSGAYNFFPYSVYESVLSAASGNSAIAGMAPEIASRVSVMDQSSGVPQPNLYLVGVNANQSSQLGPFVSDTGSLIAGPAPGGVLLDDLAASELNASAGDSVVLYGVGAQAFPMTVQAVVQDNIRGAFPTGGLGDYGSVFVNLSMAQQLMQTPGMINYLTVTNAGSQAQRLANAPTVSAALNSTLAGIPAAAGLTVEQVFRNALAREEASASDVSALFLVLGLFSIAAGALLIVGIFLLLAEERKGEMGVIRAMGLRREELVYVYLFEGTLYSVGSALAGTGLGVAVGYGLAYAFGFLIATPGLTSSALQASFTVSPGTLVVAYAAGFLLTIATVSVASRRASRLNIVRAIRDLPEPDPPVRTYTYAALVGGAGFLLGALLYESTYRGTSALSYPVLGGALMIAGLGLIAARFVRNRLAFSGLGVALLVWGGYEPLRTTLLGTAHGGGAYGLFLEAIVLISGALLLYAFNSTALASGLTRMVGGRAQRAPVAMVALAHPGRRPGRTTVSLSIFALVAFTLVLIAGVGSSLDASLSTSVQDQSGGYAFVAYSATSAPALPSLVAGNTTLARYFSEVVPLANGGIEISVNGSGVAPYDDSAYSGPAGEPAPSDFYTTNRYSYSATENGMSAAQVNAELASEPGVAVVDKGYSSVPNNLATSTTVGHPTVNPGDVLTLRNPLNGNTTEVAVIGVMTQSFLSGVFVSPPTAAALGISEEKVFLMALSPGISVNEAARAAKTAFFPYGLVLVNIEGQVASTIAGLEGEIALFQVFVGLGLVVGIAGMGIVALRSVAERRREIGMLRATGFTEGMVLRAFILEYSFVTLMGLAIGAVLGILLVWNITHSAEGIASTVTTFAMPWSNLGVILLVAYGCSMLAVASPSRLAARLAPATAVRPKE